MSIRGCVQAQWTPFPALRPPKNDHDANNTTSACGLDMAHCPCTAGASCPDPAGVVGGTPALGKLRVADTRTTAASESEPIVRAEVTTTTGGQTTTEHVEYGTQ